MPCSASPSTLSAAPHKHSRPKIERLVDAGDRLALFDAARKNQP
jgi:hypothetical protein